MITEIARAFARAQSIQRALAALAFEPAAALIIAPSTRGALLLAGVLCERRPCFVTHGPISSHRLWKLAPHLRTPAEIGKALAGQSTLPRTVISFPDQHVSGGPACVQIPFLGSKYLFSTFEALLVLRHRPPVYALSSGSSRCDFALQPVRYDELFSLEGHLLSLPGLVRRLLMHLEQELVSAPQDWLARQHFALKSEEMQWLRVREELKDVECLLRMHLQTRYCDRLRTATALAAVVARERLCRQSVAR